ncbi:hypothetical protein [Bradyrhizobium pachyrhizi]|uniref:hypothetical protein n=1 Tax=Bradyrhizobium pachyrhizi TaxID=280333 RepID=UPI003D35ECD5
MPMLMNADSSELSRPLHASLKRFAKRFNSHARSLARHHFMQNMNCELLGAGDNEPSPLRPSQRRISVGALWMRTGRRFENLEVLLTDQLRK